MSIPVVAEIEKEIYSLGRIPGQCLRYAHCVANVLHRHGMRPVIQAGSMSWPLMLRDEDDGEKNTHFSYI